MTSNNRYNRFDQSLFSQEDFRDNKYAERDDSRPTCVEICAGAGGQALGLELAGFRHLALVEIETDYCRTLLDNRPNWNVIRSDVADFSGEEYKGADLFAAGVPCPPFSKAGKQLGEADERDLFPDAIRLVKEIKPKAILIENVRGIFDSIFDDYRSKIIKQIEVEGYNVKWELINSSDYGVPQLRPRAILVGIRKDFKNEFTYPSKKESVKTVGDALYDLLASNGWKQALLWKQQAQVVAPTIVGGSKKHGGPDLGPTRARRAWAALGIDGSGIANEPPSEDFEGMPKLTTKMIARVQGFPDSWKFFGGKTIVCRQIGNAFPPPVAEALGNSILSCLSSN